MILSLYRVTFAACAVVGLLAGALAQDRVRFTDERFPGSHEEDRGLWLATRVVDDLTGEPLAGAEVFYVSERLTPIGGEFWYTAKTRTDADGWLRPPAGNRKSWHKQVVRHPGYATSSRGTGSERIWRVARAFDMPVKIVDWRRRPAAGALVGFCGGCGHTPDLVHARAGDDGVAVLRGIDPHNDFGDLYVQHPGLSLYYDSVYWLPGDPPPLVVCEHSPVAHGRVVDHEGKPLAGAFVRGGGYHRGPWGQTRQDGSFTILGMHAGESVYHVRTADGREAWFPNAKAYPVTVHFPDPDGDDPREGTIDAPKAEQAVVATREIGVSVVGAPWPCVVSARYVGVPFERVKRADRVAVPLRGPCVLHVEGDPEGVWASRAFAFDDAAALPDPVVLTWQPAVRVRGRAVDGRGRAARVRVRWRFDWSGDGSRESNEFVDCIAGRFELASQRGGTALVEIAPMDERLLPRLMWLRVPSRDEHDELDLGDVVLRSQPQLRVVAQGGQELAGATVGFARAGWQAAGEVHDFPLRADGAWLGPDLREGDAIVVRVAKGAVPFRTVLAGAGPWKITVPFGELRFDLAGIDADEAEVTLVIGDHGRRLREGAALIGLPKGPLRCRISAAGRRTAVVDTVIGDVPRVVSVELPRR